MVAGHLSDIPGGTSVFVDANIFIYHASGPTPLTPACSTFLKRIEDGVLHGVTSTVVLIEVLHRLMILEGVNRFNLPLRDALRYLEEHPQQSKALVAHQAVTHKIQEMGLEVLTAGMEDIERSHLIKRQYGFLTNDALLVAVMERSGVTTLASNDPDFNMVETITLYRPAPGG